MQFCDFQSADRPWPDRQWGLCIFDDVLEHFGPVSTHGRLTLQCLVYLLQTNLPVIHFSNKFTHYTFHQQIYPLYISPRNQPIIHFTNKSTHYTFHQQIYPLYISPRNLPIIHFTNKSTHYTFHQ